MVLEVFSDVSNSLIISSALEKLAQVDDDEQDPESWNDLNVLGKEINSVILLYMKCIIISFQELKNNASFLIFFWCACMNVWDVLDDE